MCHQRPESQQHQCVRHPRPPLYHFTDQSQLSEEEAGLASAALDGLTAGLNERFAPPEPGGRDGDDASDGSKYTEQLKNIAGVPAEIHAEANNLLAAARAKVGVAGAGAATGALGLISAGQNLAESIRAGDVGQAIADGASAVGSLVGVGEAAAIYGTRNIPAGTTAATTAGRLAQGVAKWAGPVGSLINVGTSIFDLANADGDPFKVSQAVVGIAGGTLAAAVGIGAATGAVGGPVGAAIGLITYGVQWIIGKAAGVRRGALPKASHLSARASTAAGGGGARHVPVMDLGRTDSAALKTHGSSSGPSYSGSQEASCVSIVRPVSPESMC